MGAISTALLLPLTLIQLPAFDVLSRLRRPMTLRLRWRRFKSAGLAPTSKPHASSCGI